MLIVGPLEHSRCLCLLKFNKKHMKSRCQFQKFRYFNCGILWWILCIIPKIWALSVMFLYYYRVNVFCEGLWSFCRWIIQTFRNNVLLPHSGAALCPYACDCQKRLKVPARCENSETVKGYVAKLPNGGKLTHMLTCLTVWVVTPWYGQDNTVYGRWTAVST